MNFFKLLIGAIKEIIIQYKKVVALFVLLIIALLLGLWFFNQIKETKQENWDRKHNLTSYSLQDQANMTYQEKLKFDNMKRGLVLNRKDPVVQEIVRTQYVYGQEPQTVFKEVQYVARGGESKVISKDTQKAIQEKADETKIIEEEKSVDVYKINNEKNLKLKVGATYLDNKGYINYGVQYKRIDGIIHTKDMNPAHIDGATVMYTYYMR